MYFSCTETFVITYITNKLAGGSRMVKRACFSKLGCIEDSHG